MARRIAPLLPPMERRLSRLGERIRTARLRRRLSAKLVAERAGMSVMTLRAVEHGGMGVHDRRVRRRAASSRACQRSRRGCPSRSPWSRPSRCGASELRLLLAPGASLGGARPKATIVDTDGSASASRGVASEVHLVGLTRKRAAEGECGKLLRIRRTTIGMKHKKMPAATGPVRRSTPRATLIIAHSTA